MLPDHAPFSPEQKSALGSLLPSFSAAQQAWLSGFLAAPSPVAAPAKKKATPLTILYGTESGNSEALADLSAKKAKKSGFKPVLVNMADTQPSELKKAENLLVIVSTWGDGDPPETAVSFHQALQSEKLDLSATTFSVCALGDTSYEQFCQTGKEVDTRLAELGAKRLIDRVDCDVDYDEAHAAWLDDCLKAFAPAETAVEAVPDVSFVLPAVSEFSKKNPFPSEVLANARLSGDHSEKETVHLEFSLEGSGLTYEPGDALAILPENAPDVISDFLKVSGLSGSEEIELKGPGKVSLDEALRSHLDITSLSRAVIKKYQALAGSEKLAKLLAEDAKDSLKSYLWGRQIVDLLEEFPIEGLTAHQLTTILRKLPPRLYSIASSPLAHEDEVHLTVAAVRYHANGRSRKGVASTFLADQARKGVQVPVYTHQNKNFRLPQDGDTPIIMVGPGTGVAPFRAFVEHRAELGHQGKSWLFFGEQRFNEDFLYQLEWYDHLKSGALTSLDVAFSRDQPEKIYVQHRLAEKGRQLYALLEEGAHFYVCGDAERMAVDVHETLHKIVQDHGHKSAEEASAYLDQLRKERRYQRDVY